MKKRTILSYAICIIAVVFAYTIIVDTSNSAGDGIYYVQQDATGTTCAQGDECGTITEALNYAMALPNAQNDVTVHVAAGTISDLISFDDTVFARVSIIGDSAKTTFIDGSAGGQPVIAVNSAAGPDGLEVSIEDITIQNGAYSGSSGDYQYDGTNCGGGIYNNYARISISNVDIFNNIASLGAGVCNLGGEFNAERSAIHENVEANAGGGIFNQYNFGGEPQSPGIINMVNTTISRNTAEEGGGIYNGEYEVLPNEITCTNCTIAENGTDNIFQATNAGNFRVFNTIIAIGNGSTGVNCSNAPVDSEDYNDADDTTCILNQPHDNEHADLATALAELSNTNGQTYVHPITVGSDPHNSGEAVSATNYGVQLNAPSVDQWTQARPSEAAFDRGAYEIQQDEPTPTPTPTSTISPTPTPTTTLTPTPTATATPTSTPTATPTIATTSSLATTGFSKTLMIPLLLIIFATTGSLLFVSSKKSR